MSTISSKKTPEFFFGKFRKIFSKQLFWKIAAKRCLSMFDHFVWLALKALMLFAHLAYSYKYDFDASIQQA